MLEGLSAAMLRKLRRIVGYIVIADTPGASEADNIKAWRRPVTDSHRTINSYSSCFCSCSFSFLTGRLQPYLISSDDKFLWQVR
jgi:hypothetical protein